MKSCTCLLTFLIFAISVPAFSETYDLTAFSSDGGSVSPTNVTVPSGGSQTFTATPDAGYEVDQWSLGSMVVRQGGTTYTVTNIHADQIIYVTFKKVEYTITATTGPNGSISPTFTVISAGGDGQFTAISDIGYTVDTWYLDGSLAKTGGINLKSTNIQANHTVHVTFRKALAYSLGDIEFDDEWKVETHIINNNMVPDDPDKALVLIDQVGFGPDPDNAVMGMRGQKDLDPT
jgi:hypothetical protein